VTAAFHARARGRARYALQEEALEESGWKLVHGDVLRPPSRPLLLAALLGTGLQLMAMASILICEEACLLATAARSPAPRAAYAAAASSLLLFSHF